MAVLGITLDGALKQLLSQTQERIKTDEKENRYWGVRWGAQLRQVIENAQIAYRESLHLTVETISPVEKKTLEQLEDLLPRIQQKESDLAARIQRIAQALPLYHDRPYLKRIMPGHISKSESAPIQFKCLGNFKSVSAASMSFNGQKFSPASLTSEQLEFTVNPATVFPDKDLYPIARSLFSEGDLELSWQKGTESQAERIESIFRVTVIGVPPSPGSMAITSIGPKILKKVQNNRMPAIHLIAREHAYEDYLFKGVPTDQWRIEPKSSQVEVKCTGGYSYPVLVSEEDHQVVYKGSLHMSRWWSPPAQIWVTISFREYQEVRVTKRNCEEVKPKWGEKREFPYSEGNWGIALYTFDGAFYRIESRNLESSPYFKIECRPEGFTIRTITLAELDQ